MNYYLLMAAIGAIFAVSLYFMLVKRGSYPVKLSVFAYVSSVFGLLAGGRLLGIISAYIYKLNTGKEVLPGIVFYGGLLGFLAVFALLQKAMLRSVSRFLFDCAAVTIPLFHAIGRVGCFLSGCCTGFVGAVPVQLVEALGNLVIFTVLLILHIKQKRKGSLTGIYLVSYAFLRFFDEFFRNDPVRGFIGVLSVSQVMSILIVCGVSIYCAKAYFSKTPARYI